MQCWLVGVRPRGPVIQLCLTSFKLHCCRSSIWTLAKKPSNSLPARLLCIRLTFAPDHSPAVTRRATWDIAVSDRTSTFIIGYPMLRRNHATLITISGRLRRSVDPEYQQQERTHRNCFLGNCAMWNRGRTVGIHQHVLVRRLDRRHHIQELKNLILRRLSIL